MGKAPGQTSTSNRELADALRRLTIRYKAAGLSRRDISRDAVIDGVQLDDFTTKRANSETAFRTTVPNETFLQRLLVYLWTRPETKAIWADSSDPNSNDIKTIEAAFAKLVQNYGTHPDLLFEYYRSKDLITAEGSRRTSEGLAGQFYAYRFSSEREKLVKTYFKIEKPARSESIPTFVNYRKEPNVDTIRETTGHVLNINENFVFFGFVKGFDHFVGVKIVVLHHGDFAVQGTLSGVYISHDNDGSYDVGRMILMPTGEKFDKKNIGMVNVDQLAERDKLSMSLPKKTVSDLVAALNNAKTNDHQQILQIAQSFKLVSSINIKFSNQTDGAT